MQHLTLFLESTSSGECSVMTVQLQKLKFLLHKLLSFSSDRVINKEVKLADKFLEQVTDLFFSLQLTYFVL